MTTEQASQALSQFAYTLFIVGTHGDDGPHFMIANWGTQTSFAPKRFAALVKTKARTLKNIQARGAFTINLLDTTRAEDAREIMKRKGSGLAASAGSVEAPRVPASYAGFDCRLVKIVDLDADHALVVGEVVDGWKQGDGPALTLPHLGLNYAG